MHKFHKIDSDHNILHVNKSCIQILRSNAINQRIHTPLGSEGRTRIAYNVLTVDCALDVHTLLFLPELPLSFDYHFQLQFRNALHALR